MIKSIAISVLWLAMFLLQEVSVDDGCMMWNIKGNRLIFSCRTNDLRTPLSLFDNRRRKHAKCIFEHFENQRIRCSGLKKRRTVNVDVQRKEVRFTIYKIKSRNVDGRWKCVQGNRTFTSNVSILKGIVNDTKIYLDAKVYRIDNRRRISLRCSSCRESRGNNVEFLINHTSQVSISYDPLTGKCTDRNGECNPDICSCLATGNEFRATFSSDSDDYRIYSCDMQFKDDDTSMIFSKTANIRFDGTDFKDMKTFTTIIKMPEATNKESIGEIISTEKRKDETDLETENITVVFTVIDNATNIDTGSFPDLAITVIVSIIVLASLITCVCVYYHRKRICFSHQRKRKSFSHQRKRKTASGMQPSVDETSYFLHDMSDKKNYTNAETMTDEKINVAAQPMNDEPARRMQPSVDETYHFLHKMSDKKNYSNADTMTEKKKNVAAQTMTIEPDEKNYSNADTMTDQKIYVGAQTMTIEPDEKNYSNADTMTDQKIYVGAQTMTIEPDEKDYNNAETMTDEEIYVAAQTMIRTAVQAQTAIKRPKSFDIGQKYPGIIVFGILKMKREIVFTGIKDHNKKLHQLFVVNTDNLNTQCFDLEKKPYNITSLDDNVVAVSYPDKREVDMINIKTGRQDKSIKVLSLAIFQSDDQLFVINFGKLERITKDGCSIESFNLPTHMIDHISVYKKRLYYTCHESLYCCCLNGTLIWKFKTKIEKRLSGVTTDRHGNIYVSSADPVNVLFISHEGQFLKNISYDFSNETKPVKLHFDKQHNCLAILRHSNNVIDFFDVR